MNRRLHARRLDLDQVAARDRWEVTAVPTAEVNRTVTDLLDNGPGTVVVIDRLDRVLPERNPEGGWARRRFRRIAERLQDHLGVTFHRFLNGTTDGRRLTIVVNGEKVRPWDPFARQEEHTLELPVKLLQLDRETRVPIRFRPFVLPPRRQFSSPEAFDRAAGPERWNRQQGLYIYRSDRLIQMGGWSGLRAADEHTKLARAALEFDNDADEAFRINVAKMRVILPSELRAMLERPVQQLCNRANAAYRSDSRQGTRKSREDTPSGVPSARGLGTAMLAAAAKTGDMDPLMRIYDRLATDNPDAARSLGWG